MKIIEIPDGIEGTAATVEWMKTLIKGDQGALNPRVISLARQITADIGSKDHEAELRRVYDYTKKYLLYRFDPRGLEYLQTPYHSLFVEKYGDCDDGTIVIGALTMALGMGVKIRTIMADPSRPTEFSHVYPLVGFRDAKGVHWFPADFTQQDQDFGWEPPPDKIFGAKDWMVAAA